MATIEINRFEQAFKQAFGEPKSDIKEVITAYYKGDDYESMTGGSQIVDAYVMLGGYLEKSKYMKTFIDKMKATRENDQDVVAHEDVPVRYENWEDAIVACIEIASMFRGSK